MGLSAAQRALLRAIDADLTRSDPALAEAMTNWTAPRRGGRRNGAGEWPGRGMWLVAAALSLALVWLFAAIVWVMAWAPAPAASCAAAHRPVAGHNLCLPANSS
jgi:hypothetical protein